MQDEGLGDPVSLTISVAALAVSVFTLWLTQWRRGRLKLGTPKLWAGQVTPREMHLVLPLAFVNSGARTVVVHDLRLIFLDEENAKPFEWIGLRPEMHPERGEFSFPEPVVVPPRSVAVRFCQFDRRPGREPEAGDWLVRIEAQTLHREGRWSKLSDFRWGIGERSVGALGAFITHRNAAYSPASE